ncbi:hypothetical protein, partial [Dietzia sp. DQ11-44]
SGAAGESRDQRAHEQAADGPPGALGDLVRWPGPSSWTGSAFRGTLSMSGRSSAGSTTASSEPHGMP